MQVFKTFFKVAKSSRTAMAIYTIVFLIMCIIYGAQSKNNNYEFTNKRCNVVVYDYDKTEASEKLIKYLSEIHNVELEADYSDEDIQDRLYYLKMDYVLYINEGYETNGSMTNIKRPGTMIALYIDNQINMFENEIKTFVSLGYSWDEAYDITMKSLDSDKLVTVLNQDKRDSNYFYFSYLPYILLMVISVGVTPILIEFNKRDIADRTNVAPITNRSKNVQLMLGTAVMSIGIWAIFVVTSFIIYGVNASIVGGILINSFVFMLICVGIGSVAGNFALDMNIINLGANIIGLGMSFLGGIFVPIGLLSSGMQKVARFIPSYWYIEANRMIYDGDCFSSYANCIGIQLLFAIALFSVAMLISKRMRLGRSN